MEVAFYLPPTASGRLIHISPEPGMSAADVQPMQITAETVANYEVLYSRIISYTPPVSAAGVQAASVEFSVMGPGSKLKVYVAPQVPATVTATSLLADAVIGGVGGYRQVTQAFAADTHAPLTTSTLPTETIKLLFDKIEPLVALSYVPLAKVKSREILSSTLAYWEGPMGFQQAELIPVYSLMVKTTFENNSTSTYETYIPVNGTYMAPYAKIVVPTDVPTTLLPGATLKLQAADAAQTLATLGIDPSLTFALGTGNPDSYIYDWYLNSVATENKIGTGRALSYLIKGGGSEAHGSTEQKIILVVKDSLKASEPNTSSAEFSFVFNNLYLPAVRK